MKFENEKRLCVHFPPSESTYLVSPRRSLLLLLAHTFFKNLVRGLTCTFLFTISYSLYYFSYLVSCKKFISYNIRHLVSETFYSRERRRPLTLSQIHKPPHKLTKLTPNEPKQSPAPSPPRLHPSETVRLPRSSELSSTSNSTTIFLLFLTLWKFPTVILVLFWRLPSIWEKRR